MREPTDHRLYTLQFFKIFGAVMLLMTSMSLQFHFGQYVSYRGHGVDVLGLILGASMIGPLVIRLRVGRWVDRYGVRPVWFLGAMFGGLSLSLIQFVEDAYAIAALRTLTMMSVSSAMTAGTVFAAHIAPVERRAESIGSMGLAGFLGMIVGPALGDLIFRDGGESITPYRVFFMVSAVGVALSGLIAATVRMPTVVAIPGAPQTTDHAPAASTPGDRRSGLRVIRDHWPGMVLLMGVAFSMVFTIQSSFLERFAESRGFHEIKTFFYVYCPTAIVLRVLCRRVPQQFGRTRTMLLGAGLMAVGLVALTGVTTEFGLMLPGVLMGAGHCFIFPSMVDLSAGRLPPEHRGTGTALILGAGDVGMLIGFTVLGEVINTYGYATALYGLAGMLVVVAGTLALSGRSHVFGRRSRH